MLTPSEYDRLCDQITVLYAELDNAVINDMIRRIMRMGYVSEATKWQAKQLQESGLLYEDILAEISKRTDSTTNQVRTLFEDAGVQAIRNDNRYYRAAWLEGVVKMSDAALQTLNAGYVKCQRDLSNLTLTTANTSQTEYINACDLAYMEVTSGTMDYGTAICRAVQSTAEKGSWVLYPTGHHDRLDVAVRRSVLTGVGQTVRKLSVINANDMGCDLMEITAHAGARPSHAEWQGQIVSLSGRKGYLSPKDIGYGTGDGFGGWNCRHDWFPFFEGISSRAYSEERLQELNARNIEINGQKYTEYEVSQMQRKLERKVREMKRRVSAADTAVKEAQDEKTANQMKDLFSSESVKLKKAEQKLKDFLNQTGNLPDSTRTWVSGFSRSTAQKAVHASKKAQQKKNLSKPLTNSNSGGTINSSNRQLVVYSQSIPSHVNDNICKAVDNIARDFPVILEQIEPIRYGDTGNALGICNFTSNISRNNITMSEDDFSNPIQLLKKLNDDFSDDISYETDNIESLIAHEIGHAIHNILALKRAGVAYGSNMTLEEAMRFKAERDKIKQEVYLAAFTDESLIEIYDACINQLGNMTYQNPAELIAQCFGNYYYGKDKSEIAIAVVQYFKKELT